MTSDIDETLRERARTVEAALDTVLSRDDDSPALTRLRDATRHAALAGGKRLRPFLTIEAAVALGGTVAAAVPAACAIEMVHCYSLVHDDLPAMDDAETRRGRPSVHVAYDEAIGILAGDALLTDAFAVISEGGYEPAMAIRLVRILARGAGSAGMVGGQMMDLYPCALDEAEIVGIQARKTGALIEAATVMGGVIGGGTADQIAALRRYAGALGLAFQVRDDVLDATADAEALGKPAGQDEAAGKATFVELYGLDGARARVAALTEEAKEALGGLPNPNMLAALASRLEDRES